MPHDIIDEKERYRLTGVPERTWRRWESEGTAPKRIKLGAKKIGFDLREVLAWREARKMMRHAQEAA